MKKHLKTLFLALLVLWIPLQTALAIERNASVSTTGSFGVTSDEIGEAPIVLSIDSSEDGSLVHLTIESEPNATVKIYADHLEEPIILQTDDTAQVQVDLELEPGTNTFELITIDYWENISEPTPFVSERSSDFLIYSHENSQITFTPAHDIEETEFTYDSEKSFSIISLNKDRVSRISTPMLTLKETDITTDTDGDSFSDAIEIIKGEDPTVENLLFTSEIDVLNLDGSTFTNSNLFLYGTAPADKTLRVHLENENESRYLAWSGRVDLNGTFTVNTPFHEEGTFKIIIQSINQDGSVESEAEYGTIIFDRSQEEVPLTINAHYKVNSPTMTTSIFSLEEIGRLGTTTLFGPNIDLSFEGDTNPLSEIFILWKGEAEWFLQTISHPESGKFNLQAPESVPSGEYSAYIYSQDLKTSTISDIVKANFNVTTAEDGMNGLPINTLLYLAAALMYISAIAWAAITIREQYIPDPLSHEN
ncbi:hypothetical protein HN748_01155 [Candidatus Peregrinibacteria bacterium]|nr:hypothetical protein [Candidatus Peregrinibacteria bacterium]MBT7483412.1 hypothetical protein [Candidatus Peregrinibacteria bacterium]MBT7702818.1 hypothetical protein [Candidatus Peregrinibacteria bacterium]